MTFDRVIDEVPILGISLPFGDLVALNSIDVAVLSAALVAMTLASLASRATRGTPIVHCMHGKARQSVARWPIVSGLLVLVAVSVMGLSETDLSTETKYLGIAGLLIGIAAQGTLSDLLSGLAIRPNRSLALGDLIEIDGLYGYVYRGTFQSISPGKRSVAEPLQRSHGTARSVG